jgi:glutathione S-transferase
MILIGQYDSPFVRRVGIALQHYGVTFEHRPWSVWGNAAQIAEYNPLRRVPTLLLEDGTALADTFAILDYVDELVSAKQTRLLVPRSGTERRDIQRVAALAGGIADKAVTLLYSSLDLMKPSVIWSERCRTQILESLAFLEAERAKRSSTYWFGEALTHADIAIACSHRFTREAHPELLTQAQIPGIAALAARCEALPEFKAVYLPITNNLQKT